MTGWDIKPQGVQGQLKVVGGHAGELEKALNALMKDLGQAPLSQAATGPVAAALGEYAQARQAQLKSMSERIQAAVLGAATATNEYVEGDPDTAKQAQNAAKSVRLDLLKDMRAGK